MKKFIVSTLASLFLFSSIPLALADSSHISLSDAVIADLALRNSLNDVSISMIDGKDNQLINLNPEKQWIPASTVKTYVAMYAYDQMDKGNIQPSDTIIMDGNNIVTTEIETPEFPAFYEGESVTIDRLVKQMITQSDNTAYNQLLDVLDRRAIVTYVHSLGLTHTEIGSKLNLDDTQTQYEQLTPGFGINTTTADDYSKAFVLIKDNKIAHSQDLLNIFKKQKINNMLPAFLPNDVVVAHKTGDWNPLYHDGGIIIPPNGKSPYVLSIFSNLGDPTIVAHISQLVYSQDLSIVGQVLGESTNEPLQALDELLKHPPIPTITPEPKKVLGISNFILQTISAADLGITAKDLSLSVNTNELPKVIIPADSPLHNYVTLWYLAKKIVAPSASARTQIDLDALNLQIAEAQALQKQGKTDQQNVLLMNVQNQIQKIAKTSTVASNSSLQVSVEQVSQQRFALLGSTLTQASPEQRAAIIQTIAQQAKETVTAVEPNLPQASHISDPASQPLIGTVIKKTNDSIVIQTPGGQQITVPTNQNTVKVRSAVSAEQTTITPTGQPSVTAPAESVTPSDSITPAHGVEPAPANTVDAVKTGSTIAVVGTASGTTFHPTFILTHVPRELVAPQPVTVIKVNTKNDTMVVSENGILTQVDLNKQTIIKAGNTNVSLPSIKSGDIIVVHGNPVPPPSTVTTTPTIQLTQVAVTPIIPTITPTISSFLTPSPIAGKSGVIVSVTPQATQPLTLPIVSPIKGTTPTIALVTTAPKAVIPTTSPTTPVTTLPSPATPQVVVGKTIQVIDTKQQQSAPPPSKPASSPAPVKSAPPAPPASAPQPAAPAPVVPAITTKK